MLFYDQINMISYEHLENSHDIVKKLLITYYRFGNTKHKKVLKLDKYKCKRQYFYGLEIYSFFNLTEKNRLIKLNI